MEDDIKKEGTEKCESKETCPAIDDNVNNKKNKIIYDKSLIDLMESTAKRRQEEPNPDKQSPPNLFTSQVNINLEMFIKKSFLANPFYLVSACLTLYASTCLFHTENVFINNLVPLAIMGAYTALLAGTAIFITKLGKVWDDAGTLLQINVMLFMAISVGLDGKVIENTSEGVGWIAAGLAVMLAISEMMFNGLKLKIPIIFRTAYYTLMGVFFVYPWALAELVTIYEKNKQPAIIGMLLFPVIGAILFVLTLTPMIRKGPKIFKQLGAPWSQWRFPASIFMLILIGFGCRTYLNTISFYGGRGVGPYSAMQTGFDAYMLIPLLAVVAILLLEVGINQGKNWLKVVAMSVPVVILFFIADHQRFDHNLFLKILGNYAYPILFAWTSIIVIYLYAWYRRISGASICSGASIFISALSINRIYAINMGDKPLDGVTLFVCAALLVSLVIMTISMCGLNRMFGIVWCVSQGLISFWIIFSDYWFFKAFHGAIPITAVYLSLLVCSTFVQGKPGKVLRLIACMALPVLCLAASVYGAKNSTPYMLLLTTGYCLLLVGIMLILAFYGSHIAFLISGAACMLFPAIQSMIIIYSKLSGTGGRAMFWAMLFFVAALLLSMVKGKMFHKCSVVLKHKFS